MRDHPRTRGEKCAALRVDLQVVGSPPHTRGKGLSFHGLSNGGRITPAHAGKRFYNCPYCVPDPDHPRTRGEKWLAQFTFDFGGGSPPHTRGKADIATRHIQQGGITPAHAGKSPKEYSQAHRIEDHPRTRGEKHAPSPPKTPSRG